MPLHAQPEASTPAHERLPPPRPGAIGNGLEARLARIPPRPGAFPRRLPAGPLIAQRYVVFDLHLTGLDVSGGDRLLSIGAVRLRDGEARESFTTLVNPARTIPPGSIRASRHYGRHGGRCTARRRSPRRGFRNLSVMMCWSRIRLPSTAP
jgi:hypothetical protein